MQKVMECDAAELHLRLQAADGCHGDVLGQQGVYALLQHAFGPGY